MPRKYTGFSGNSKSKLAGTEEFMRQLSKVSGGALWNNGTFSIRKMRGKESDSVHGTGRAGDASYRHISKSKGAPQGRVISAKVFNKIVTHANLFGLELLIDYQYGDFGKTWRCDRNAWIVYTKQTVYGGGTGDWFHFELSPEFAASASKVKQVFLSVFGPQPV